MEKNHPKILIADKLPETAIDIIKSLYGDENVYVRIHSDLEPKLPEKTKATVKDIIEIEPTHVFLRSTKLNEREDIPEVAEMYKKLASKEIKVDFIRVGSGVANLESAAQRGHIIQNTPRANSLSVVELQVAAIAMHYFSEKLAKVKGVESTGPNLAKIGKMLLQSIGTTPDKIEGLDDKEVEAIKLFQDIIVTRGVKSNGKKTSKNNPVHETLDAELSFLDKIKEAGFEETKNQVIFIDGVTGNQGRFMLEIAKSFGMNVIAVRGRGRTFSGENADKNAEEMGVKLVESLEEAFSEADVISINVPLGGNKGFIKQGLLDKMKAGACLINTARAEQFAKGVQSENFIFIDDAFGTIDELKLSFSNLIKTNKVGAKTEEAENRASRMALLQMRLSIDYSVYINVTNPDALEQYKSENPDTQIMQIKDPDKLEEIFFGYVSGKR